MEMDENELMEDEENSDGVTEDDLKRALKEVRGKKIILKMKHKLKKNLRARSKNKKLADLEDHLESKGIDVNKESLKQRIKKKSIGELETNADKASQKALAARDSDGDNDQMDDGDRRGRKRRRSMSDDDDYMEIDQVSGKDVSTKKSTDGYSRSMTPK
jgi:hypothetical protein